MTGAVVEAASNSGASRDCERVPTRSRTGHKHRPMAGDPAGSAVSGTASNAMKFTPKGGAPGGRRLDGRKPNRRARQWRGYHAGISFRTCSIDSAGDASRARRFGGLDWDCRLSSTWSFHDGTVRVKVRVKMWTTSRDVPGGRTTTVARGSRLRRLRGAMRMPCRSTAPCLVVSMKVSRVS